MNHTELLELVSRATPDWFLRPHKLGPAVCVGGPFHDYKNGSAQSQILMAVGCGDGREAVNIAAAVAAVNYIRSPEFASLVRKAERYDFIRDHSDKPNESIQAMWAGCKTAYPSAAEWDAAIDAAIDAELKP